MRHHWPRLFEHDPVFDPKARALAERGHELSEILAHVLKARYQDTAIGDCLPERVVLHTSYAAPREIGTRSHGVELTGSLPGVTRIEHERESECQVRPSGFGRLWVSAEYNACRLQRL